MVQERKKATREQQNRPVREFSCSFRSKPMKINNKNSSIFKNRVGNKKNRRRRQKIEAKDKNPIPFSYISLFRNGGDSNSVDLKWKKNHVLHEKHLLCIIKKLTQNPFLNRKHLIYREYV